MTTLDEHILTSMQVARRHHLAIWSAALEEHRRHPSFQVQTWPMTLEYGFTCACEGHDQEWKIKLTSLKEAVPKVRDSIMRVFRARMTFGQRAKRREVLRSEQKARSLLHRYLTKGQRLELRKTNAFTMTGKDGRTYKLRLGSCANIETEHEGHKYVLCVIAKEWIPNYDTLLAQKVMLETEPEVFLRMAKARNHATEEYFDSGAFLLGEKVRGQKWPKIVMANVTDETLENPQEWIEARVEARMGESSDA